MAEQYYTAKKIYKLFADNVSSPCRYSTWFLHENIGDIDVTDLFEFPRNLQHKWYNLYQGYMRSISIKSKCFIVYPYQ